MSQANVEVVRSVYAALVDLRHLDDPTFLEEFGDYFEEGVELQLPSDYPEAVPVFKGPEGLEQWAAWLSEAWANLRFEPERFIDAGERVVVFETIVARSRSGVPVELPSAPVVTIRDGRVASIRAFRDRSQALKAVGLAE
jgi:ketosteroid isomerase-like protein